jgi:predicted permease
MKHYHSTLWTRGCEIAFNRILSMISACSLFGITILKDLPLTLVFKINLEGELEATVMSFMSLSIVLPPFNKKKTLSLDDIIYISAATIVVLTELLININDKRSEAPPDNPKYNEL